MCEISQYINLFEGNNCQITFCKGCKTFSLTYNSCCASFTAAELNQFKCVLEELREQDYHYDFMGKQMAIVKNPMAWIGFCLSKEDVEGLLCYIRESLTLYDAFHIIYQ
ncbi:MAG: DUF6686 family protein [Bacteroidota bacterium]